MTEILFHPGHDLTAKGVRITSRLDGKIRNVYAKKEVILAAGAVMTPQLLQVSGLGPAKILGAANITVKKDMPGLGANYQDHATTMTRYTLANQSFPNPDTIFLNATYNATVWTEYLTNKTGPIAGASATTLLLLSLPQLSSLSSASSLSARLLSQNPAQYLPPIYSSHPALLTGYKAQRAILAKLLKTKQQTAYEMCPCDWSSDVCSSDLRVLKYVIEGRRDERRDAFGREHRMRSEERRVGKECRSRWSP